MRASDLVDKTVRDRDGVAIGHVGDIRLVQDGPLLGVEAAWCMAGLVVVSHGIGSYLGYDRGAVSRPVLFDRVLRWAHRNARYVEWSAVDSVEPDHIRIAVRRSELPGVPQLR